MMLKDDDDDEEEVRFEKTRTLVRLVGDPTVWDNRKTVSVSRSFIDSSYIGVRFKSCEVSPIGLYCSLYRSSACDCDFA
jgi:hypothetical protein